MLVVGKEFDADEWAEVGGGLRGVEDYADFAVTVEHHRLSVESREDGLNHGMAIHDRNQCRDEIGIVH